MKYTLLVLPEAEQDADRIYRWIAERSPAGADRWYEEFAATLRRIASEAECCALAPENVYVTAEIRQILFKTKNGLRYRILFSVAGQTVRVLHVRGPGQRPLDHSELRH
jgi:plasmid stabilization system protein ParE